MGKAVSVFRDTAPVHRVTMTDFRLSHYEITVAEFLQFAENRELEFPYRMLLEEEAQYKPCLPAMGISWRQAQAYCQSLGGRLPTEAEWEYAARVSVQKNTNKTARPSGEKYPVINVVESIYEEEVVGELEMKKKERNDSELLTDFLHREMIEVPHSFLGINGLYGMIGNVWEWVHDWYGPYPSSPQFNPQGAEKGFWKVIRGGSYLNLDRQQMLDPTLRNQAKPDQFFSHVGFRCAWEGK